MGRIDQTCQQEEELKQEERLPRMETIKKHKVHLEAHAKDCINVLLPKLLYDIKYPLTDL